MCMRCGRSKPLGKPCKKCGGPPNGGGAMEDRELRDQIRKAVRRYAVGIRRDDVRCQLSYEDGLVLWIYDRIRKAEKQEPEK